MRSDEELDKIKLSPQCWVGLLSSQAYLSYQITSSVLMVGVSFPAIVELQPFSHVQERV
jgi:hypothetical protein